jgi:hypothetical protein
MPLVTVEFYCNIIDKAFQIKGWFHGGSATNRKKVSYLARRGITLSMAPIALASLGIE